MSRSGKFWVSRSSLGYRIALIGLGWPDLFGLPKRQHSKRGGFGFCKVGVESRLQDEAARRGDDFNLLILRYGIERLLFRLSQSAYADCFLLKGAMLFVAWDEKTHRPTRDFICWALAPSNDATKQTQWAALIRRNGLTGLTGHFAEVVFAVRDYLAPVLRG